MSAKAQRSISISITDLIPAGVSIPEDSELSASLMGATAVFSPGTGAGQINLVAFRKTSIVAGAPSATVSHDYKAIPGLSGQNVAFTSMVGLYHYFMPLETGQTGGADKVILGASGASGFDPQIFNGTTPSIDLPRQGIFALDMPANAAGWDVAVGTKDFKFDAGTFAGADAVVRSYYIGRGA